MYDHIHQHTQQRTNPYITLLHIFHNNSQYLTKLYKTFWKKTKQKTNKTFTKYNKIHKNNTLQHITHYYTNFTQQCARLYQTTIHTSFFKWTNIAQVLTYFQKTSQTNFTTFTTLRTYLAKLYSTKLYTTLQHFFFTTVAQISAKLYTTFFATKLENKLYNTWTFCTTVQ